MRYPFVAVEGHAAAKHALLLLAVDPELRGALIASKSCSAKSVLGRAFGSIYPAKHRVPDESSRQEDQFDARPIELPIGVTEDRLLGGLDLERTLATGKRQVSRGLLARADGQILYVDNVNLLEPGTATHLAHALDYRRVQVERESVSATHSADFVLVATFNPEEGEPSTLLRDRIALIVEVPDDVSPDERRQIIERDFRFEQDPASFVKDFEPETAQLNQSIQAARQRLPGVKVSRKQRRQIAQIAMRLAVEGNRADVFALKAARANAALASRDKISDEDVIVAVRLVLAPRSKALPSSANTEARDKESSANEADQSENPNRPDTSTSGIEDVVIAAIDERVPKDLLEAEQQRSRASRGGRHFKGASSHRGRYVRSDARRTREARIAIDATLRAAAPLQLRRRLANEFVKVKQTQAAALDGRRVKIEPADLRYKKFKHRSGIMFIFAVDASGSMALNRLAQAKGALIRLLGGAYLHRDKVALISFRGDDAQVLLAPTRSVDLAKRLVDTMPAGGGTPVSAGVLKAIELARLSRHQGMSRSLLVLFTDGRANVCIGRGRTIEEELRQIGELLRAEGIASVIVDTKPAYLGNAGQVLANALGCRYVRLTQAAATPVHKTRDFLIGGSR
jgi:magnesium chelatase subunit D